MADPGNSHSTGITQSLQCNTIIVFHPGSKNLRFGRASDAQPQTILHAIGRRRSKGYNGSSNEAMNARVLATTSTLISKSTPIKFPPEVESARLQLCHTLQTSLKSDGSPRYATPSAQIAAFNKKIESEEAIAQPSSQWNDFPEKDIVVGKDVLSLDSTNGDFHIHFPWQRGQPNVREGVGGSLTSVFTDLEDIWRWCLEEKLEISPQELKYYKAVVVIPALFDRTYAREIMNLVLNRLGFGSVFLMQDHVCATFGCGLACATVVDVGDQKISVSCVEDGVSLPQSRLELKYGGGDLTLALWNLMSQCSVPFEVNLKCLWDVEYLNNLKEKLCHCDLNRCGPEERTITWDKPGEVVKRYNVLLGDELLIVPLSFFNPDLLKGSVSSRVVAINQKQWNQAYVPDDPFDVTFITETSRRGLKEVEGDMDEDFLDECKDNDNIVEKPSKIDSDQLLGMEQVILQSIESCNLGEELKRRLFSCILVVGGGFKFRGLGSWLHSKITMNTPRMFRSDAQEVITQPKGSDPATTAWKGAAIICGLETANELWINKIEWNSCGSRILREKSLSFLM